MTDKELWNIHYRLVYDWDHTDLYNTTLSMLAQRIHPSSYYGWWDYVGDTFNVRCLICGSHFSKGVSITEVLGIHGMQHLKDLNLLAFV